MKTKSALFFISAAFCINVSAYSQAVNKKDSLALVDLYRSTHGAQWTHNINWLIAPVDSWMGVGLTGSRVTFIELNDNNLTGPIPASFGNLTELNFLHLNHNHLSDSIPSSFGNLTHLSDLALDNNDLSGNIPSSFGNLVNLPVLDLSWNRLSGSIPSSLGNLVNLTTLNLSSNQLSGSIPASLGNLVKLDYLYLDFNLLNDSIPSSLGNLVNLRELNLAVNELSGHIPLSLTNPVFLSTLDLGTNQLSGGIPSSLGNLVNLGKLHLDHDKLSGKIPSSIANLYQFIVLDLSYNHFTFSGMELVAQRFPNAIYSPQAPIPVHQNVNALSVSAGGTLSHNIYKWFRCGKTGTTLVATNTADSVFHPSQSGVYDVKVTNSVATQLTLHSDRIHYVAAPEFAESAAPSSENALQRNDKTNLFLFYPNPARDILHVQTNGNASFSLLDQSGKTLLSTNITGKGSINISGMAAGLYYLRNNGTGIVQKVIIAR